MSAKKRKKATRPSGGRRAAHKMDKGGRAPWWRSKSGWRRAPLTAAERAILEELNVGGAVPGRVLAQRAGCFGRNATRRLREIVWGLRSARRVPILSSSAGYWLAQTPDDIKPFCSRMQQVGRDHFAIASIVQGVTVDVVAGQMLLDMFEPGRDADHPAEPDTPHRKGWQLHLQAGRRRIKIADVLGQTLNLLRKSPELFEANADLLRDKYGVLVLSAEQARKLRRAKQDLDEILAAGTTA